MPLSTADVRRRLDENERRVRRRLYLRRLQERAAAAVATDPRRTPYAGLQTYSLALEGARFSGGPGTAQVNALLPSVQSRHHFAGTTTALRTAADYAASLDRPLRVISQEPLRAADVAATRTMCEGFGLPSERVAISDLDAMPDTAFGADDLWLATGWTTAHTIQNYAQVGDIDPARVAYLIQDYEPQFQAASGDSALAANTYHAGFVELVNSAPLAAALRYYEDVSVPDERVFAPEVDRPNLQRCARTRQPDRPPGVLFYYRPHSLRNMSTVGMAALQQVLLMLPKDQVRIATIGSALPMPRLAGGHPVTQYGRTGWAAYFDVLAQHEVILSLQATPHPSHPPLDMVASGGWAVTNEVAGTRTGLHPRLLVERADPLQLADRVLEALHSSRASAGPSDADFSFLERLGSDRSSAMAATMKLLGY